MKKLLNFGLILSIALTFTLRAGEPIVPEIDVQVLTLSAHPVDLTSEWIGTADGQVNVTISAQVTGYLFKQNYIEGALVKKGDVMFELDDRTFVAQANLAQAQLKRAQADQVTAEKDWVRAQELLKEAVIPLREFEQKTNAKLTAEAAVAVAQANLDIAKLNLSFTKIIAPIDGIAGRSQVRVGDLITPTSAMTTVSRVDPLRVFVAVSEKEYLMYMRNDRDGKEKPEMPLTLILSDGEIHPTTGKFVFLDRQVDPQTGVIQVAVDFPNPNNSLRPGIFARIKAITTHLDNAITIPQRAVNDLQGTKMVAVVEAENKIKMRPIKTLAPIGNELVVTEGLQAGDVIVVEGLQKIRDGAIVKPIPYQPTPKKP